LVIVSNRVALPGEGAQRSGGLVTGLVDALHQAGGLWFGWSGKLGENPEDPGVLILSPFAGAAYELDTAVIANPYDPDAVAEALQTALRMTLEERCERCGP
jgi:trehalose-6-phosphate synthase